MTLIDIKMSETVPNGRNVYLYYITVWRYFSPYKNLSNDPFEKVTYRKYELHPYGAIRSYYTKK